MAVPAGEAPGRAPFAPARLESLERQVGASPAEFQRTLLSAGLDVAVLGAGRYEVTDATARLHIEVRAETLRTLGSLALPQLKVQIRRLAGSPEAASALLGALDWRMQRGGG